MKDLSYKVRAGIFDGVVFTYLALFLIAVIFSPDFEDLSHSMHQIVPYTFLGLVGGILLSALLRKSKVKTLGDVIYAPPHIRSTLSSSDSLFSSFWGLQLIMALMASIGSGVFLTHFNPLQLFEIESLNAAMRLFGELASPDFSILPKAMLKVIESIFIAFMATALAVPIAFVLSFLSARNVMGKTKRGMIFLTALRMLFNLTRSVEPVLWAIIFSVWAGFGPFAGMLALATHSIASLSKQYSELVEGVDSGPIEGIESTGAGQIQTVWFAIVPQVVLPYVSYTIDRWDINVRMATILGFVGGGGIGTMLMEYQGQSRWPQVGCIIIAIAFVVWVMDAFSAHVRQALK